MNLDDASAELYGRPLDEFMAARAELAEQAKSEGDPDIARRIKALRKPTAAAWILNQLVRSEQRAVAELVTLGEAMRSATAASDGETLRDLTATRKKTIGDLIRAAKALATEGGQRAGADVVNSLNDTLIAAVADPAAGAELLGGSLTKPLKHAGFGPLPTEPSAEVISLLAARSPSGRASSRRERRAERPARQPKDDVEARTEALRELEDSEAALDDAERRVSALRSTVSELRQRAEDARSRVEQLAAELETAQRTLRDAEIDVESTEDELESARRDVDVASRRRRDARLNARKHTG